MWTKLSHFILRFRLPLIITLFAITGLMGYLAQNAKMSYDYAKVVPDNDPDYILYQDFKATFGEDGNVMAIGFKDSSIFELKKFNRLHDLSESFLQKNGVKKVVSVHDLPILMKNMGEKRFDAIPLFEQNPTSQEELDSLMNLLADTKFYEDQFINSENGSMLFLVTLTDEYLNSEKRISLVKDLMGLGDNFTKETGIELHYAGLPYLRSVLAGKVKAELELFLMIYKLILKLCGIQLMI